MKACACDRLGLYHRFVRVEHATLFGSAVAGLISRG
jgi:hypothetical protein